jgi:hypothetical protein
MSADKEQDRKQAEDQPTAPTPKGGGDISGKGPTPRGGGDISGKGASTVPDAEQGNGDDDSAGGAGGEASE